MTLNVKSDNFDLDDFNNCAKKAFMKRGRAKTIVKEVTDAVKQWPNFAEKAGVTSSQIQKIQNVHRLKFIN